MLLEVNANPSLSIDHYVPTTDGDSEQLRVRSIVDEVYRMLIVNRERVVVDDQSAAGPRHVTPVSRPALR